MGGGSACAVPCAALSSVRFSVALCAAFLPVVIFLYPCTVWAALWAFYGVLWGVPLVYMPLCAPVRLCGGVLWRWCICIGYGFKIALRGKYGRSTGCGVSRLCCACGILCRCGRLCGSLWAFSCCGCSPV